MKFFAHIAFLSLICSFLPVSYVHAQDDNMSKSTVEEEAISDEKEEEEILSIEEAKALIAALPTAGDAVKGVVKQDSNIKYYDMHGRQLAYRENIKDLRASLEERRKSFEAPRIEIIESHRSVVEKVYAAEMKEYNKITEEDISAEDATKDDVDEEEKIAEVTDGGLTEQKIPAKDGDVNAPKKKVITSSNAPDFDPSNL